MNIKEIKSKYKEYLTQPYIASLNLSDEEILKNLPVIIKIVDEQKQCDKLDATTCINANFMHLRLIRDNKGALNFCFAPCSKEQNDLNWWINDFKFDETKLFDLPFFDKEAHKNLESNKHAIITQFLKDILLSAHKKNNVYHTGIYLFGNYGVGKTLMMYSLLNSLQKEGYKVALISVPKFVQRLKDNFDNANFLNKQFTQKLENIDFLVLDDIGAEQASEWFYNQYLFNLLDYRYVNKKTTLFTSNYQLKDLAKKLMFNAKLNKIDAGRVIERIKALTNDQQIELKDRNYRYSKKTINLN